MSTLIETMTAKRSPPRPARQTATTAPAPEPEPTDPPAMTLPPHDHPDWQRARARVEQIGARRAALETAIGEAEARLDDRRNHAIVKARAEAMAEGRVYAIDPPPDLVALRGDLTVCSEALSIAMRHAEDVRRRISGRVGAERREEFHRLSRTSYECLYQFFKSQAEEQRFLRQLQDQGVSIDHTGLTFRPLFANGLTIGPGHLQAHHEQLGSAGDGPLRGSPFEEFISPAPTDWPRPTPTND